MSIVIRYQLIKTVQIRSKSVLSLNVYKICEFPSPHKAEITTTHWGNLPDFQKVDLIADKIFRDFRFISEKKIPKRSRHALLFPRKLIVWSPWRISQVFLSLSCFHNSYFNNSNEEIIVVSRRQISASDCVCGRFIRKPKQLIRSLRKSTARRFKCVNFPQKLSR